MRLAEGCECWTTLVCDVTLTHHVQKSRTYHYAVLACKLVQARQIGLTLVGVIEDAEVVVITLVCNKDISDEFQDRGLPDSSLSNEKHGAWCFRFVRRTLDDPLLEKLYVAGNTVRNGSSKVLWEPT